MKFHAAAIIVVVVSLLFIGATTFIDDLGSEYNKTADYSGINATKSQMNEQKMLMNDTYVTITGINLEDEDVSFVDIPYRLIKGGWTAFLGLLASWSTLFVMLTEISGMLNLPGWVGGAVFTIIMTLLVAMIIYLVFKWRVEAK